MRSGWLAVRRTPTRPLLGSFAAEPAPRPWELQFCCLFSTDVLDFVTEAAAAGEAAAGEAAARQAAELDLRQIKLFERPVAGAVLLVLVLGASSCAWVHRFLTTGWCVASASWFWSSSLRRRCASC
jgi:hypothetical protein